MFDDYAHVYDSLYRDKNYQGECDFVEAVCQLYGDRKPQSILDLGCGTGNHALPLAARGYNVCGLDRAPEMLHHARRKQSLLPPTVGHLEFQQGCAQTASLNTQFDLVLCLFAVITYQTTDEGILALLRNVRHHLRPGGLFICDFWHGPAVLSERPTTRVKEVLEGDAVIRRTASSVLDEINHLVTVHFSVSRSHHGEPTTSSEETHQVRYLFSSELERFLPAAGLEILGFCPFPKLHQPVTNSDWNVTVIARSV